MDRQELVSRLGTLLAGETELEWAYLFGSSARGERYRDVDVAVMPAKGRWTSLLAQGALVARLEETLGMRVDVVDLRDAPPLFCGPLLRERIVLLDRAPAARADWEAETAIRAIDYRQAFERAEAIRYQAMRHRPGGG